MKEQTQKAVRDREVAFHGKSACYGTVIPFGEGKKQTKSQAPADEHGEKLSGISEEVPPHGAMKPVCFQTLHPPLDIPSSTGSRARSQHPKPFLPHLTLQGRGRTQTGSDCRLWLAQITIRVFFHLIRDDSFEITLV